MKLIWEVSSKSGISKQFLKLINFAALHSTSIEVISSRLKLIFIWYQHFNKVQCSKTCKISCNCDFFFLYECFVWKFFASGILSANWTQKLKSIRSSKSAFFIKMIPNGGVFFVAWSKKINKNINESYFPLVYNFLCAHDTFFLFIAYGKAYNTTTTITRSYSAA